MLSPRRLPSLPRRLSPFFIPFDFNAEYHGNRKPESIDYDPPATDPHKNLLLAVLIDAIQRAIIGDTQDRAWILADSNKPFSSDWICDILEIDKSALLERIYREWKTIKVNGLSPYLAANQENLRSQTQQYRVGGNNARITIKATWPQLTARIRRQRHELRSDAPATLK